MELVSLFAACVLAILSLSQGQILAPIPLLAKDPGIPYFPNPSAATIKLEAFLDLNCKDSAAAWSVLKQVADRYGRHQLNLVIQQLPLPYHKHAFLCAQVNIVSQHVH